MGECLQIFVAIFKHVVLPIKVPMISIWQLFIFIFDMCQTTNLKLLKKNSKKSYINIMHVSYFPSGEHSLKALSFTYTLILYFCLAVTSRPGIV